MRLAQLNAPATVSARNALRSGKLAELNALGQYLPNIGVTYNASNFAGGQFIQGQLVPYQGNPWNYGKGYGASLLLFDGGQRYFAYRQAQAQQRSNAENETLQRYGVAYAVKQQYFAVLQARELEAAGASALEQAQVNLNASASRVKVGAVVRTDSLRATIQVGTARLALLNARAQLRDANAALTRLVASNTPVTAIAADTSDVPRLDVDDAALARMADDGPNVRQAVASFEAAKQGRRATITSQFIPQVRASYGYNASAFTSPTFNWGGGPAASTQHAIRVLRQLLDLQQLRPRTVRHAGDGERGQRRGRASRRAIQREGEPRAAGGPVPHGRPDRRASAAADRRGGGRSRRAAVEVFLGAASYLDLLTSQTALDAQRILLINARFTARTTRAAIEAFVGHDLK